MSWRTQSCSRIRTLVLPIPPHLSPVLPFCQPDETDLLPNELFSLLRTRPCNGFVQNNAVCTMEENVFTDYEFFVSAPYAFPFFFLKLWLRFEVLESWSFIYPIRRTLVISLIFSLCLLRPATSPSKELFLSIGALEHGHVVLPCHKCSRGTAGLLCLKLENGQHVCCVGRGCLPELFLVRRK